MTILYKKDGTEVSIHHTVDVTDAIMSGNYSKVKPEGQKTFEPIKHVVEKTTEPIKPIVEKKIEPMKKNISSFASSKVKIENI